MTTNHPRESIINLTSERLQSLQAITHEEQQREILKSLILSELKNKLDDTSLEPFNLHIILKYVMESVENTPLKGVEQKEFAISLITELVNTRSDNDDKKIAMLTLLDDGTIGNMIDLVVDATKGKLDVNKLKTFGFKCFTVCFPLLCMNKTKSTRVSNLE